MVFIAIISVLFSSVKFPFPDNVTLVHECRLNLMYNCTHSRRRDRKEGFVIIQCSFCKCRSYFSANSGSILMDHVDFIYDYPMAQVIIIHSYISHSDVIGAKQKEYLDGRCQ